MLNNNSAPSGGQKAGVRSDAGPGASPTAVFQPRYVRLPRSGTLCPYTGLSRSQMWLFIKEGRVKSHSLKRRGTCRGVRVVEFASLCQAIASFAPAEEQEAASAREGGQS